MSHDPSEIILTCWFWWSGNFIIIIIIIIIIINVKTFALLSFMKTHFLWIGGKKLQHLFKKVIFCNIKKVFTITFDQFNVSLLNKIFIYLKNM